MTTDLGSRDPKIDPQPGDAIRSNGRTRRVVSRSGNRIQYVFEPGDSCALRTWEIWAQDGEVLPALNDLNKNGEQS